MKVFELNWHWYEDSNSYLFFHQNKDKEDFELDCKNLILKYFDELLKECNDSFCGANNIIYLISLKLPELGYEPIETIIFSVFGAYIPKSDYYEYSEEGRWDFDKFKELIGEDNFLKIIKHNDNVENNLLKE